MSNPANRSGRGPVPATGSAWPTRTRCRPATGTACPTGASSATCARAPAGCTRASAACASSGTRRRPDRAHHATAARAGSASTRSRRSRSTTSCPARGAVVRHRRLQPGLPVLPELGHLQVAARSTRSPTSASPETLAEAAERLGCRSVAFTYNDPVIFMEYAIDVADACRERGIKAVAVTAGYMNAAPRARVLRAHGRRQRRPQGVHRGLLPAGHLRPAAGRCWTRWSTCARDRRLVRDHHAADPRPQRLRRRDRGRVRSGSPSTSGPTCRCTSPRSTPTSRCATCRRTPPATLRRARRIALRHGPALRLHRQRARPGGPDHLLPRLRRGR